MIIDKILDGFKRYIGADADVTKSAMALGSIEEAAKELDKCGSCCDVSSRFAS